MPPPSASLPLTRVSGLQVRLQATTVMAEELLASTKLNAKIVKK